MLTFLMHGAYIMRHIHGGLLCLSFKNKYFVFTTQMQLCLLFRVYLHKDLLKENLLKVQRYNNVAHTE